MVINIREMRFEDISQVIELWQTCDGIGLSDDDNEVGVISYLTHSPGLSFVAVASGQVVGALLAGQDGR